MSSEQSINPLKARLDAGKPGVGALLTMPSVPVVQAMANVGFDWLFIDMEHCPIDINSAHAMIAATAGSRTAPIVRVPWNVHWLVKPVLDAGAMGVIFPTIRSAEEAQEAVRSVRYPPEGERGFGPFYGAMRFGLDSMHAYIEPADREILSVLLIEHRDAVEDIERIVAVPGVDVLHLAPFDLALSYGHRDGVDHQDVTEGVARVEEVVLDAGKTLGGLALDAGTANDMIERGYRFILGGFDVVFMQSGARDYLSGVQRGD